MVIGNPGKICCWNGKDHGVCDQDFGDLDVGLVMFLVSSGNCRGRPHSFFLFFNERRNCVVILMYACSIANCTKKK